jgi:hypothetical protein
MTKITQQTNHVPWPDREWTQALALLMASGWTIIEANKESGEVLVKVPGSRGMTRG